MQQWNNLGKTQCKSLFLVKYLFYYLLSKFCYFAWKVDAFFNAGLNE